MKQFIQKQQAISMSDQITEYVVVPIYFFLIAVLYGMYFMVIAGYSNAYVSMDNIVYVRIVTELLIGAFLVVNFHPWRSLQITTGDKTIIFAGGSFLLFNVLVEKYAMSSQIHSTLLSTISMPLNTLTASAV